MEIINAKDLDYRLLNESIKECEDEILIENCLGQRFVAAGLSRKKISINGIPGNALGAYLNNAEITVNASAQDAVGDTMNDGKIVVLGNIGDAAGYAMRGGKIYIKGNAGYRAGIHMKAYGNTVPLMIIGGKAGSFLGEYQAGGIIIVLGLAQDCDKNTPVEGRPVVGNFPCTGMHGGKMFIRGNCSQVKFPRQVTATSASPRDMEELSGYLKEYSLDTGYNLEDILDAEFTVITPDSNNPYTQMYVAN